MYHGYPTIAYYLNAQYFGNTKKNDSIAVLQQELDNNNINYYFVWIQQKIYNYQITMRLPTGKWRGWKYTQEYRSLTKLPTKSCIKKI